MIGLIGVPLLIFLVRVVDVTLGTIRIISISRDFRILASVMGFFEVLIWLIAITQIMRNLDSPLHYIAYAAGFGMGNFVGISIERFFSYGNRAVRVITRKGADELITALRQEGYGVTSVDGEGIDGPVKVLYTVIKRSNLENVIQTIRTFNPRAFYTVEDIRFVRENSVVGDEKRRFRYLQERAI